jgi:hypothetical protein
LFQLIEAVFCPGSGTAFSARIRLVASGVMVMVFAISSVACAQVAAPQCSTSEFYHKIVGEWIGVCEQTTDGERAGDKYFHVAIVKTGGNTFESHFEYYRLDPKNGSPVRAGESKVVTTIGQDGLACSRITGSGSVLVYQSPKMQHHELQETVKAVSETSLRGEGTGTISVSGMPFGLGKNGKVTGTKSTWTFSNGTLSIHQTLKVGFRALFIKKSFDVVANYTAKRGVDVATLMAGKKSISAASAPRAAFE